MSTLGEDVEGPAVRVAERLLGRQVHDCGRRLRRRILHPARLLRPHLDVLRAARRLRLHPRAAGSHRRLCPLLGRGLAGQVRVFERNVAKLDWVIGCETRRESSDINMTF